jgi:hypothetical protein
LRARDRPLPDAHPARLILTLSLAATVGLGIGRFAYALVLPDMRDSLHWSYSAAGFMNTINAVGYLAERSSRRSKGSLSRKPNFPLAADRSHRGKAKNCWFRASTNNIAS